MDALSGASWGRQFDGFWEAKWNQVGIKMEGNIDRTSKSDLMKKPRFSLGKIHFFEIQGVEVESKNRSKNDVKNDAETEGLENSIFIDF